MRQDLDREVVTDPAQSPEASHYFTPHVFPRLFPIYSLPSGQRAVGWHCHCGLLCQSIKGGGLVQLPYVMTLAAILRLRLSSRRYTHEPKHWCTGSALDCHSCCSEIPVASRSGPLASSLGLRVGSTACRSRIEASCAS